MKALKQLLFLIKNDPRVKRLNELENVIDHSKKTKQIHEEVKQLQKAVEFFKVKAPVSSSVLPDILSDTLKADKEKNSYSA